ncbi:DUF3551 domain-containing protein [Bradyrhizobium manausense]|uniref:DUF3551 domain-containing protein n=1 Tax=Bradyrhizobium manausense TaxID=989370 RepID=UPI001BA59F3E|nr:DUF3551 domain-containing protein [Bradyrhizobium manausense]MBR1087214.1 DUF3551 domain-containing protein [Bradyrhizobium manausense]
MRMLCLMILAGTTAILGAVPATAQRYDPRYQVCLQSWHQRGLVIFDCSYNSMDQCRATASGLSAMCLENPYWQGPSGRHSRRRQGGVS